MRDEEEEAPLPFLPPLTTGPSPSLERVRVRALGEGWGEGWPTGTTRTMKLSPQLHPRVRRARGDMLLSHIRLDMLLSYITLNMLL